MKKEPLTFPSRVPISWQAIGLGVLIVLYLIYKEFIVGDGFGNYLDFLIVICINFSLFYLNALFFLPKVIKNKRNPGRLLIVFFIVELAILALLVIGVSTLLGGITIDFSGGSVLEISSFIELMVLHFNGLIISFAYYGLIVSLLNWKEKKLKEQENRELLNQVEIHKLEWLKAQLPTHFLENTMAMLRYTIKHEPTTGTACLSMLCDILKYYASPTTNGMILLSSEIEQVKRYMDLQKLRFNGERYIKFDIQGQCLDVKSIPMIILLLVENIYKYGVLDDPEDPAELSVLIQNQQILIFAQNAIQTNQTNLPSTGTGLINLKGRLEHFYPDNHAFLIEDSKGYFRVSINISL